MTYDPTYNFLTSKTYKQDASTTIKEQNIPTTDGKSVGQSLVYVNNSLKAQSDFVYDNYGNVSSTKEYTDADLSNYIQTNYTYDSGTYLTGITIDNVCDADGTVLGNISRHAARDIYDRILTTMVMKESELVH